MNDKKGKPGMPSLSILTIAGGSIEARTNLKEFTVIQRGHKEFKEFNLVSFFAFNPFGSVNSNQ